MRIRLSQDGTNLKDVVSKTQEVLSSGGLVVFPSDTVYGLLVDAKQEEAVSKLIAFKNRPIGKAISVFVSSIEELASHAFITSNQKPLLESLLPGPFTVILNSRHTVSNLLESETGTLGFRIPDYEPVRLVSKSYRNPITATSANLGGRHPHYSIESLLNQLPKEKQAMIDLIVDAGKLPRNKPSTVLDMTQDSLQIVRKGDIITSSKNEYRSPSPKETRKLGAFLLRQSEKKAKGKPIVFLMTGELGTGKTEMSRGIAEVLGIPQVVSPTFVVSYEYEIPHSASNRLNNTYKQFVHADLYNIMESDEMEHIGLDQYLDKPVIMVIEWGERMGDFIHSLQEKTHVVLVTFSHVNENERIIRVHHSL